LISVDRGLVSSRTAGTPVPDPPEHRPGAGSADEEIAVNSDLRAVADVVRVLYAGSQ
jgi:hypothetical protein